MISHFEVLIYASGVRSPALVASSTRTKGLELVVPLNGLVLHIFFNPSFIRLRLWNVEVRSYSHMCAISSRDRVMGDCDGELDNVWRI